MFERSTASVIVFVWDLSDGDGYDIDARFPVAAGNRTSGVDCMNGLLPSTSSGSGRLSAASFVSSR